MEERQLEDSGGWVLVYFVHRYLPFRRPEFESCARAVGWRGPVEWRAPPWLANASPEAQARSPLQLCRAPSLAAAAQCGTRCVLVKAVLQLWGHGEDRAACCASVQQTLNDAKRCGELAVEEHLSAERSFRLVVDALGTKLTMVQQLERVNAFAFVPFRGEVSMKHAQTRMWVVECGGASALPDLADLPAVVLLARQLALGPRQRLLGKLDLKKRAYLGPTAMDHEMSLIMANMGCCRRGTLTLDPFAGTGSVLVAAAECGATVMGGDMDIRVVRDGKKGKNVFSNFRQYALPPPCLLRCDAHAPPWRTGLAEVFDSIVCDPPYGIRAGGRKSGGRKYKQQPYQIPDDKRADHIASTSPYPLGECIADLLDNAARMLRPGGRLVYFLPAATEAYSDGMLPRHPALEVVADTPQHLTRSYQRRLVTMQKPDGGEEAPDADAIAAARAKTLRDLATLEDATARLLAGEPVVA